MPKQKINHSTPLAVDEIRFDLTVGWQRDRDVQVGISASEQSDGQHHLIDHVYGDPRTLVAVGSLLRQNMQATGRPDPHQGFLAANAEHVLDQELGRMVLDAVCGSSLFGDSVWWHPTRHMINELIRTLRKARDAAYGTDA